MTFEADSHLKASSAHSITVEFAFCSLGSLQPISSLPSPQSFCPSHSNCLLMHWPFEHWKSSSAHFSFSAAKINSRHNDWFYNQIPTTFSMLIGAILAVRGAIALPRIRDANSIITPEFLRFARYYKMKRNFRTIILQNLQAYHLGIRSHHHHPHNHCSHCKLMYEKCILQTSKNTANLQDNHVVKLKFSEY
jgi:hypothetical protein